MLPSHFDPVIVGIAAAALVVTLTAIARQLPLPTPILQLIAGFLIGLIPGIAVPDLSPNLVFFVFLPPILWSAAMFTSVRDFSRNIRPIGTLAVGLVLVTTRGRGDRGARRSSRVCRGPSLSLSAPSFRRPMPSPPQRSFLACRCRVA